MIATLFLHTKKQDMIHCYAEPRQELEAPHGHVLGVRAPDVRSQLQGADEAGGRSSFDEQTGT